MGTKRTTIAAFSGTRADLLKLLRDLHDGTACVDGVARLTALDAVCEVLADTASDAGDVVLAGRVASALSGAIVRQCGVS